jgi:hypothetical protein
VDLYTYNERTGHLTNRKTGRVASGKTKAGYITVQVQGKKLYAHRVAWLLKTGAWPEGQIDHIDGDRANNSFGNLRDASRNDNLQNRTKSAGATGFLGVSFHSASGKYNAQIFVDGRNKSLGLFPTAEEAHAAYLSAKEQFHNGFVKNHE